jgi:hypothetical protein
MSLNLRSLGRALFVGGFVGACFVACAEGSNLPAPDPGTGGNGAGGTGTGIPPGQIGGTCVNDESCKVEGSSCVQIGGESYCTVACPPQCPKGTYCAIINGDPMCVPDLESQCLPCTTILQCLNPSDACLTAPAGDKFCARDCTTTGECPNGFTCLEGAKYPPKQNPDPGGADAGTDGGSDGGTDGGTDAGPMMPPAGQAYKFCVPNLPFSCPCTAKRDGVEKDCSIVNQFGTCSGVEVCMGDKNKFEGCTAQTPAAESCNAKDDNCDGTTDEGDPNALCTAEGPIPPHGSYVCSAKGTCDLGPCEAGWAAFPPGPVKDGCACAMEAGEPNNLCANATSAGMVTDTPGSNITLAGTLSAQDDVDVWTFDTVDTDELTTNSYHVSINFTSPMPNEEFVMDVIHGDACTDTPSGNSTNITSYTWCVDGRGADGTSGEIPCANDGTQPVHCNNNSSKYFVIVRRKLGATGTCSQYNVSITAAGGTACDFTQKCE